MNRAALLTSNDRLVRMGARLKAERKRQKVSAVAAAEAAGISRVTLHRIESGEGTVGMAAWLAAVEAAGLTLDIVDPSPVQAPQAPPRVRIKEYPQLSRLAWQLHGVEELPAREALSLYERNWRHLDPDKLTAKEQELIEALSRELGGGRLLV
ncbi:MULTISPECIES: helix-turn-helix domain-containing protein [Ramlibacter]|uniref:Helix-turn-helix domain-containing protein n=1 Tax=Ramlibacter aquaticus TaxID=2780094 RepID=A0ABR9SJ19_9BURK|nr:MULTISPECIES: helix-turn-helix domain-containing protein [Ramlibacter]MBE7942366.1 helix-turn-helix domain-containing protein [Ramlibacter aquaticus]